LLYDLTAHGSVGNRPEARIGKRTKTPGLWLMAAVRDIATSEESYHRLSVGWRNVEDLVPSDSIRSSLRRLEREIESAPKVREVLPRLREIVRQGRSAKNDIFFRDDPFVMLGVLFVLATLIRHRRLPS
jgi:hypothetical protein